VPTNGAAAEEERFGDLPVRSALGQELQYIELTACQGVDRAGSSG
jgi:hypothetical protein